MPNIKILIFNWQDIKNPYSGGAEVHLHEIFSRIAKQGNDVTLVCSKFEGCLETELIDDIKIVRRGRRNTFNFVVPKIYKKEFLKSDYDIVIDDINKIPFYTPLYVGKPLLAISHHLFGNSIFKETNIIAGLYVYLSEWLIKFIYTDTKFCAVSESTKNDLISKGIKKVNIEVVYNAINQDKLPMKVTPKYEEKTITYFGRLKKYKSIDQIIKAFSILRHSHKDLRLYIIGKGDYQNYLQSLCVSMNIEDSVVFWGFVDEDKKIELLSKSHLVINSSNKEGWGITNIESNACGTPVISANSPGLRDSVKNGTSGYLYEYGDIHEMASLISNLLNDKKKLLELSEGAVKWASEFSWDSSAEKMTNLIKRVINSTNN